MDCPVCNSSGITEDSKKCPHCNADLEAFQLTRKIEKTSKNKLLFGWVATILFFCALIVIIVFFVMTPEADQPSEKDSPELTQLKTELEKTQNQNETLLMKNNELKTQLDKKTEEKAKREKIYVVKAGETLFTIARKVLGNGYKYQDIAKDNNISNPDILITGQKLVIYY
jgi:LysM repeat protein